MEPFVQKEQEQKYKRDGGNKYGDKPLKGDLLLGIEAAEGVIDAFGYQSRRVKDTLDVSNYRR